MQPFYYFTIYIINLHLFIPLIDFLIDERLKIHDYLEYYEQPQNKHK